MKLTGAQYQQLSDALRDAFTKQRLAEMIRFKLDKNLDDISLGGDYRQVVFELIRTAEAEGWTDQLLLAARESNPGNASLLAFAQQLGAAPPTPPRQELERIIRETSSFLDVSKWRTRLGEIEAQVCRVEIASNKGVIYGTGFLLGPDVVMTNYHVIDAVIAGEQGQMTSQGLRAMPGDVTLRFDYKRQADGTTLNPGAEYHLATAWLIDKSPMSPVDGLPQNGTPKPDELDYALLRVAGAPGAESIGKADPGAAPRGWIKLPEKAYAFQPDTALFIMQHPQGEPLKLALDTDAVIGVNANGTRVMYKTNTEPGSSGSPCFNSNWDLVALHHSGDPNFDPAHKPAYNEGIPLTAILALLEQRGLAGVLGEQ
jgi:V8-like Glu-specific endopeptidase